VRESKLMTQRDLAELSGIAMVTVARLEGGHTEARFTTVKKLAQALGVEPAELMEPTESR
jgi:transcriptional regulator with XRE-family HTH domain